MTYRVAVEDIEPGHYVVWVLDLPGCFALGHALPGSALPEDPLARLRAVRGQLRAALPELIGDARLTEEAGETWSARKIVHRSLWHDRDYTWHLARLAAADL